MATPLYIMLLVAESNFDQSALSRHIRIGLIDLYILPVFKALKDEGSRLQRMSLFWGQASILLVRFGLFVRESHHLPLIYRSAPPMRNVVRLAFLGLRQLRISGYGYEDLWPSSWVWELVCHITVVLQQEVAFPVWLLDLRRVCTSKRLKQIISRYPLVNRWVIRLVVSYRWTNHSACFACVIPVWSTMLPVLWTL